MFDKEKRGRRPRGRPRAFDTDGALDRAMEVFWCRGYDGAAIAELTEAMKIAPPSLYAAFGDKRGLFLATLERYGQTVGAEPARAMAAARTDKLRALLDAAVDLSFVGEEGRGCFAACVAAEAAGHDPAIRDALRVLFASTEVALQASAGDGLPGAVLLAALHALGVRARAGATRSEVTALARALEAQLAARPAAKG